MFQICVRQHNKTLMWVCMEPLGWLMNVSGGQILSLTKTKMLIFLKFIDKLKNSETKKEK